MSRTKQALISLSDYIGSYKTPLLHRKPKKHLPKGKKYSRIWIEGRSRLRFQRTEEAATRERGKRVEIKMGG
jgi:hypothetical protein